MKFQEINKKQYQYLLKDVLFKTFFHEPAWQDILAQEFGFIWRYFNYKNELIISMADLGNGRLISHPFCEYGGPLPLIAGLDFPEFKKDLLQQFPRAVVRWHPQITAYFSGIDELIDKSNFNCYWLENFNQQDKDQILANCRKTLRHEIVKASKQNITIKPCQNLQELKKFYQLYIKTIKKKGNLILPFKCFEYFQNNQQVEILLAIKDKKIIGGSVFLHYGQFIHYFINAIDNKFKSLNSSYLILWEKIKQSAGKKYQVFDFGGTRAGSSLEVFKRGWGTVAKPIIEVNQDKDIFGKQKPPHSGGRLVWKLLPNFLAKYLSKKIAKRVL